MSLTAADAGLPHDDVQRGVVRVSGIRRKHHTSSREVAEIAKKARFGLLILYHRANPGGGGRPSPEQVLLEEVRQLYGGKVVIGHDLDVV